MNIDEEALVEHQKSSTELVVYSRLAEKAVTVSCRRTRTFLCSAVEWDFPIVWFIKSQAERPSTATYRRHSSPYARLQRQIPASNSRYFEIDNLYPTRKTQTAPVFRANHAIAGPSSIPMDSVSAPLHHVGDKEGKYLRKLMNGEGISAEVWDGLVENCTKSHNIQKDLLHFSTNCCRRLAACDGSSDHQSQHRFDQLSPRRRSTEHKSFLVPQQSIYHAWFRIRTLSMFSVFSFFLSVKQKYTQSGTSKGERLYLYIPVKQKYTNRVSGTSKGERLRRDSRSDKYLYGDRGITELAGDDRVVAPAVWLAEPLPTLSMFWLELTANDISQERFRPIHPSNGFPGLGRIKSSPHFALGRPPDRFPCAANYAERERCYANVFELDSTRGRSRLRWSLSSQLNARVRRSAPASTKTFGIPPLSTSYVGPSAQAPRLPMPAFTPSSESDHPGAEARLDVGASTVDHPEHPAVQRRDSTRTS
ncbi:hypothetical protein B0H14DRAFT_2653300 [Mycena olivaceomarginata]|nr:hypothetical protein B0H14DRAFT_2653300 [Mycena olivaceomarginata]